MRFIITSDAAVNLDGVHDFLKNQINYKDFFDKINYGKDLECIAIVLMCRNPDLNFKQRIRFSKDDKTLYLDLMFHLPLFFQIEQDEKNRIVLNKIIKDVPTIVLKYKKKVKEFDFDKFLIDFQECFGGIREEIDPNN